MTIVRDHVGSHNDSLTRTGPCDFLLKLVDHTNIWRLLQTREYLVTDFGTSGEELEISHRRLNITVIGLCLTLCLTALDQSLSFMLYRELLVGKVILIVVIERIEMR